MFGIISYLGFKALDFSKIVTNIATAVPVTIGAFGVAGVLGGGFVVLATLRIRDQSPNEIDS